MDSDSDSRDKPKPAEASPMRPRLLPRGRKAPGDAAFDLWLQRGLHRMYDDVAQEPIPEELLRLIEQDKRG